MKQVHAYSSGCQAPDLSIVHNYCNTVILSLLLISSRCWSVCVCSCVEVTEQKEERDDVKQVRPSDPGRERTACCQKINSLCIHDQELSHLKESYVVFPPALDSQSGQKVIRVHHQMYKRVEHNSQVDISIIGNICVQPVEQEDRYVMVDVQKAKLSPLFTEDNKEGITKIKDLAQIEDL